MVVWFRVYLLRRRFSHIPTLLSLFIPPLFSWPGLKRCYKVEYSYSHTHTQQDQKTLIIKEREGLEKGKRNKLLLLGAGFLK